MLYAPFGMALLLKKCKKGEVSRCQQVKKRKTKKVHRLRHTAIQIKGNFGTKIRVICNAIWRNLWTKIFNLLTLGSRGCFVANPSPE
jgi:hypothetical protein